MRISHLICLFAFLLALAGCGGSGGSGGSVGANNSGGLFITDSLDNRDHVWITIEKVVLLSASGNVTVFDDAAGFTVDLKTLRDQNGERYSFLNNVPQGTYTGVQVTVDKDVTIFSGGSSTGSSRVFAGNNGSTATLSLTFTAPRTIGPGSDFALDFNLSAWDDDGTTITSSAFLQEGQGNGLGDLNRHEHGEFRGIVQNLTGTAPNFTFVLRRGNHDINVATNADTTLFNANGNGTAQLANGQHVEVRAVFQVASNSLLADSIRILNANFNDNEAEASGTASDANAVDGTFTLTVDRAHHFQPEHTTITVATNASTRFTSHGGVTLTQEQFFAALATASHVEVEGSFDAGSNTLTATHVKIEDHDGFEDDSELKGRVSNINVPGLTFDVTAQDWEGMNISAGQVIHITVDSGTTFRTGGGTTDAAGFFAALQNNQRVEVEGTFDAETSTLAATSAKFEDD